MFLVPESILNSLTCDKCKKYLSVPPVKVYPNKHIYCGRCSRENDDGVLSLYGNIMQRGLFQCINRYDGCNQVLLYSEVSSHEANCKSKLYNCPNCHLVPEMPSIALISHFQECHKESILRNSSISINVDRLFVVEDKKYFYIKENFLFIICIRLNSDHIELNTVHIGNPNLSREITQRFLLSSSFCDGKSERNITEKLPCCSACEDKYINGGFKIDLVKKEKYILNIEIDLDIRKAHKFILMPTSCTDSIKETEDFNILKEPMDMQNNKLYLSEEFKKMWSSQYSLHISGDALVNVNNKLLKCCCFCQNKFHYFSKNQSIYKCTECSSDDDTFICSKCYFFGITKCDNGISYEFAPEETTVFKHIQYFCKLNCGQKYFSWDLREHEYSCDSPTKLICPVEKCKWVGTLSEVRGHVGSHERTAFNEAQFFPLSFLSRTNFSPKNEVIIPVLDNFVNLRWRRVDDKYICSLYMKRSNNKIPVAIVNINGNIEVFTELFVIDIKSQPHLLIILRDN